jgi:hypothetical protein
MKNLVTELNLPEDASVWLGMLFDTAQVFDDFADGGVIERKDLDKLIWNTLLEMPMNPFYVKHASMLYPMIATTILKWQASDTVERLGQPTAMSFAWRAGFYDIILLVYAICFGPVQAKENAHRIMALYGENFDDYMKEFICLTPSQV